MDGVAIIEEKSILEMVSEITEFNETSEFMQDPHLDRAMELTVKILVKEGRVPQQQIPTLITELQALATVFALKSTYYMTVGKNGSAESMKKNIYFTAKESITKLVDSLKYITK